MRKFTKLEREVAWLRTILGGLSVYVTKAHEQLGAIEALLYKQKKATKRKKSVHKTR